MPDGVSGNHGRKGIPLEHGVAAAAQAVEHAAEAGHQGGGIVSHLIWHVAGYEVHGDTLIATWLVMAILVVVALVAGKNLQQIPGRAQSFFEAAVDGIEGIVKSQIKNHNAGMVSFIGTIFLFVLFANWSVFLPSMAFFAVFPIAGMHELLPPTSDINTTAALAVISLCSYFFFGIRKKGLAYFKHYVSPPAFLLPLHILEDFSRPLSLMFRLFGNVMGEHIVVLILLSLVPFIVPVPMLVLGSFFGLIQAYIFATLTASYIGAATAEHDHGPTTASAH